MGQPDRTIYSFCRSLSIIIFLCPIVVRAQTSPTHTPTSDRANKDTSEICANIAASIEAERISRQKKALGEIENQIRARLAALEAKETEVSARIERLEAFEKKADESLIAFYAGMKPDAAAAQLAELDEDIAAGILLKLKTKASSAILNEMQADRGAALIKRIGRVKQIADGKSP